MSQTGATQDAETFRLSERFVGVCDGVDDTLPMTTTTTDLARRRLGNTEIEVSVAGLGGNTFGPPRLDQKQTARVIGAALDLGVNFVDTANVYGKGQSEEFIGRAFGLRRDEMVIATKFNFMSPGEGTAGDRIRAQAEHSLKQLGTDRIDLYQLHMPDAALQPGDILEALDRLVRAGKVRTIGVCNYSSWRLAEAVQMARANGWAEYSTVQNYFHLLARESESEVVPFCEAYGASVLPYHPLGGGFLTGKYRAGEPAPEGTRGAAGSPIISVMRSDANYEKLAQLEAFCDARDRGVGDLAIAWLVAKPVVASVIAGVSNVEQLTANVRAAQWVLTAEEVAEVDVIVSGPAGVPSPEKSPYGAPPVAPSPSR